MVLWSASFGRVAQSRLETGCLGAGFDFLQGLQLPFDSLTFRFKRVSESGDRSSDHDACSREFLDPVVPRALSCRVENWLSWSIAMVSRP